MIKPTIGRVVWFWYDDEATRNPNAQACTALVTFVHSDERINVAVFDRNGDLRPLQFVPLWQGEGPRPDNIHCEWMPYQKGQAAKVEAGIESSALEKRIAALEAIVAAADAAKAAQPQIPPPPPAKS